MYQDLTGYHGLREPCRVACGLSRTQVKLAISKDRELNKPSD
jgi:hypothetical protein